MWPEEDEDRKELERSIEDLLAALQEKHPDSRAEGFVKIFMYSDGSGMILDGPITPDGENVLFEFEGKEELADWLNSGPIPEPTERE